MAGFQIPLESEIDFLKNIVIPSFNPRFQLVDGDARENWMRNSAGDAYGSYLDRLMIAFSTITSKEEAEVKLKETKFELQTKTKEEREFRLRLQQQSQGNYLFCSCFIDLFI